MSTHRFGQISEGLGVRHVQLLALVVSQDPGEDGVLHQVVVASACERVEGHQVLEVGDLAADPALSHRSLSHQGRKQAWKVDEANCSVEIVLYN